MLFGLAWLGLAWLARGVPLIYPHNLFEIPKTQIFYHRVTEYAERTLCVVVVKKAKKSFSLISARKPLQLIGLYNVQCFYQKQIYLSSPFFIKVSLPSHNFIFYKSFDIVNTGSISYLKPLNVCPKQKERRYKWKRKR